MPNLKDLRIRINSVKSTQKITSAMKMVAAAKLRRAQEAAEAARPYAERMQRMVASLAASVGDVPGAPPLLVGTGRRETRLIVACAGDRGLCGAFNASIVRAARRLAEAYAADGSRVKFLTVGRKARDLLRRVYPDEIVESVTDVGRRGVDYSEAMALAERITQLFEAGEFDDCAIVFNRFRSAMTQIVTIQQVVPVPVPIGEEDAEATASPGPEAAYIFEPEEDELLAELLPRAIAVHVFQALLESAASEHGARMTAMDSATRNAGDMIDNLTLTYNRTRQASITKELIEIISGAEAL